MATSQTRNKKIGIIGSDSTGQSWAILFAWAGYKVCLYDPDPHTQITVYTEICNMMKELVADDVTRGSFSQTETMDNISVTSSLIGCVSDSIYIQECLPADVQRDVLRDVDGLMSEDTVVASSGLTLPSSLSVDLTHRHRFLTAHPIDSLIYTTCVEIVPAPWTATSSCETTSQLMTSIGQTPVTLLKEQEGFVGFSIESAIQGATYQLVKDGFCDVDDVEVAMTEGLGMWYWCMGMFDVQHMNRNGWLDFCVRGGDMVFGVQQDMQVFYGMGGDTAKKIETHLVTHAPLEELPEARRRRNKNLSALRKMKKTLDHDWQY